jgi:hypothetical protein
MFFSWAENAADRQMITSLDHNNYNESDLTQIKFALNMPYLIANKSYERCDGQVELNGIQYNYVKRMVKNDTLYLYCIPNDQKTKISDTKNEYAKQNTDNQSGKKSEQPAPKKINSLSDFNAHSLSFSLDTHHSLSNQTIAFNNCTILKGFTTQPLQPPDLFI